MFHTLTKGKISIWAYIKAYYTGELSRNSQAEIFLIIGWLIFSPVFMAIWLSLFFTPPVYLTADRQKRNTV